MIARSPAPRSTNEIAEVLGLHPNTVRPHLERMREVGLLDVEVDNRGTVGRPQNRYFLASDAPSLGLEPPSFPLLAGLLAAVAAQGGPAVLDVASVGSEHGVEQGAAAAKRTSTRACLSALMGELANLGFDPVVSDDGQETTIAFAHCPYRELAELYPELVCQLHRGIVEGFVEGFGTERRARSEYVTGTEALVITDFHTLVDREPCQVSVTAH